MLIDQIELLPSLYQRIVVPRAVLQELSHDEAPPAVRSWIAVRPEWLEVIDVPDPDQTLVDLGAGERDAISLATAIRADAVLIDERAGRREAIRRGLRVVGTLAVLDEAAQLGLADFATALERLRETSFHMPEALAQRFLRVHPKDRP